MIPDSIALLQAVRVFVAFFLSSTMGSACYNILLPFEKYVRKPLSLKDILIKALAFGSIISILLCALFMAIGFNFWLGVVGSIICGIFGDAIFKKVILNKEFIESLPLLIINILKNLSGGIKNAFADAIKDTFSKEEKKNKKDSE